jgi:hypothetical protein
MSFHTLFPARRVVEGRLHIPSSGDDPLTT